MVPPIGKQYSQLAGNDVTSTDPKGVSAVNTGSSHATGEANSSAINENTTITGGKLITADGLTNATVDNTAGVVRVSARIKTTVERPEHSGGKFVCDNDGKIKTYLAEENTLISYSVPIKRNSSERVINKAISEAVKLGRTQFERIALRVQEGKLSMKSFDNMTQGTIIPSGFANVKSVFVPTSALQILFDVVEIEYDLGKAHEELSKSQDTKKKEELRKTITDLEKRLGNTKTKIHDPKWFDNIAISVSRWAKSHFVRKVHKDEKGELVTNWALDKGSTGLRGYQLDKETIKEALASRPQLATSRGSDKLEQQADKMRQKEIEDIAKHDNGYTLRVKEIKDGQRRILPLKMTPEKYSSFKDVTAENPISYGGSTKDIRQQTWDQAVSGGTKSCSIFKDVESLAGAIKIFQDIDDHKEVPVDKYRAAQNTVAEVLGKYSKVYPDVDPVETLGKQCLNNIALGEKINEDIGESGNSEITSAVNKMKQHLETIGTIRKGTGFKGITSVRVTVERGGS